MKETKKITINSADLKQLIKEEVARAQKIKSLKEEKARIEKILSEMEEYAEVQPTDVPNSGVDLGALEKEFASKVKLDPTIVAKLATEPAAMEEGIMDTIKGIFGKKDAAKKAAPNSAASAGIKATEDFKDDNKMQKFIGDILSKTGITAGIGGAGSYLTAAIWTAIKGSAYAMVASGLPVATIALLVGGLIVGVAGSYMKYAANKKGAK